MKEDYIFYCIGVALLCCGCKAAHPTVVPEVVETRTDTDMKIVHIETIDTVFIEIPAQSSERTTPGKESHLETDYAESDARINDDGTLTHTLRNKPTKHPVPVKKERDSVYVYKAIEKPVPVKVSVEVERELTWWEKTRLDTWSWIAAALVTYIVWRHKKGLWGLVMGILKHIR